MFCPKCGAKNEDGALFCGECGASLSAPKPQPAQPAGTPPTGAATTPGSTTPGAVPPYNSVAGAGKKPGGLNVKVIAIAAVAVIAVIVALALIIPAILNGGDGSKLKIDNLLTDNSTRVYNTLDKTETVKLSGSTAYVSSKEFGELAEDIDNNNMTSSEIADAIANMKGECWAYRVLDKRGNELSKSQIKDGKDVAAVDVVIFVVNSDMNCEQLAKEIQRYVSLDKIAVISRSSGYYSGAGYSKTVLVEFSCYEVDDDVYRITLSARNVDEYRDAKDELEDLQDEIEKLDPDDYKDSYIK